jgi:pimeloyl-ACP methyl ester carboxylesterase
VEAIAPTLAGRRAGDDRMQVCHADYVRSVVDALDRLERPAVLVGHSFGGSVISRGVALHRERCHGVVYYSAFVRRDGERVADSGHGPFVAFLDQGAAAAAARTITLPDELLREAFANTADEAIVAPIASLPVPEPYVRSRWAWGPGHRFGARSTDGARATGLRLKR